MFYGALLSVNIISCHTIFVKVFATPWTSCHPERSEGSRSTDGEILRCAQDDMQDTAHVRSREVFSPNVCNSLCYTFM